jgi:hypothetical protein
MVLFIEFYPVNKEFQKSRIFSTAEQFRQAMSKRRMINCGAALLTYTSVGIIINGSFNQLAPVFILV